MTTDPESLADEATELHPIDNLREANQRLRAEVETLKDSLVMEPQRYPGELGVLRTEVERLQHELSRYEAEIVRLRDCRDKAASLLRLANQAIYGLD